MVKIYKYAVDLLAKYVRHGKVDGCYLDDEINLWEPEVKA